MAETFKPGIGVLRRSWPLIPLGRLAFDRTTQSQRQSQVTEFSVTPECTARQLLFTTIKDIYYRGIDRQMALFLDPQSLYGTRNSAPSAVINNSADSNVLFKLLLFSKGAAGHANSDVCIVTDYWYGSTLDFHKLASDERKWDDLVDTRFDPVTWRNCLTLQ